jgi:hypothetical protein
MEQKKISREFIEFTIIWKDIRRKNTKRFLELKELRLINQFFDSDEMECIEIRVKEHFGTKTEFEQINFG